MFSPKVSLKWTELCETHLPITLVQENRLLYSESAGLPSRIISSIRFLTSIISLHFSTSQYSTEQSIEIDQIFIPGMHVMHEVTFNILLAYGYMYFSWHNIQNFHQVSSKFYDLKIFRKPGIRKCSLFHSRAKNL